MVFSVHVGRQRGIHGPRGGGGFRQRERVRGVRQALRPLVTRRHNLHPAVRLSAVLRQVRPRLRLGAWGQLLRLPGPALPEHPGGLLRVPRGRVGQHLIGG